MSLQPLFGIYGQQGVPMDFLLLNLAHVLIGVPLVVNIMRARSATGYTSLYSKDGYPSD